MKLRGRAHMSRATGQPLIVRVTHDDTLAQPERARHALRVGSDSPDSDNTEGFGAIITDSLLTTEDHEALHVALPPELAYLDEGDVVRLDPVRQHLDVIYRRASPHNSLLVTERCNSRCVMCSQPPVPTDDSYLVDDLLKAIPLMSPETVELGITGGEPTLLRDDLIRLLGAAREHLPNTALHVLSNGRLFAYLGYAEKIASLQHPDLMIGIPLYSDLAEQHDFVVQARGAFDQTLRGIINLARYRQRIEIRVVLHRLTIERLPQLARFIVRNLPFVEQVALMGLEPTGYTRLNLEALWVDPVDYQTELSQAAHLLDEAQLRVKIYNHQICVLDQSLWPFAVRSISDWKNIYMPECSVCSVRSLCGGFFASSSLRYSSHISPIEASSPSAFEGERSIT